VPAVSRSRLAAGAAPSIRASVVDLLLPLLCDRANGALGIDSGPVRRVAVHALVVENRRRCCWRESASLAEPVHRQPRADRLGRLYSRSCRIRPMVWYRDERLASQTAPCSRMPTPPAPRSTRNASACTLLAFATRCGAGRCVAIALGDQVQLYLTIQSTTAVVGAAIRPACIQVPLDGSLRRALGLESAPTHGVRRGLITSTMFQLADHSRCAVENAFAELAAARQLDAAAQTNQDGVGFHGFPPRVPGVS